MKYDKNNNLTYYEDSSGVKYWYLYNKNNKKKYIISSNGTFITLDCYIYNIDGEIIYHKYYNDSYSYECWYKYDDNGNTTYLKKLYNNTNKYEEWKEYDDNGNLIHLKNTDLNDSTLYHEQWSSGINMIKMEIIFFTKIVMEIIYKKNIMKIIILLV